MITAVSIRTPRLRLEPLTVLDTDALFAVLDDPALHTFTGGEPRTRAEFDAWVAAVEPGHSPDGMQAWCNWLVVVIETGSGARPAAREDLERGVVEDGEEDVGVPHGERLESEPPRPDRRGGDHAGGPLTTMAPPTASASRSA